MPRVEASEQRLDARHRRTSPAERGDEARDRLTEREPRAVLRGCCSGQRRAAVPHLPQRPAHDGREQRVALLQGLSADRVSWFVGEVPHDRLVEVEQRPTTRRKVVGELLLLAEEEQQIVEPTGVEEGLPPHDGGAREEPEHTR